jgi:hypothetical protein
MGKAKPVIARIWRGRTRPERAHEYEAITTKPESSR